METSVYTACPENVDSTQQAADFRPISITPVRIVVQHYIYPVLSSPPPTLHFADQFAFRPTGSTSAAIISLLYSVINLLSSDGVSWIRWQLVLPASMRSKVPKQNYENKDELLHGLIR